MSSRPSSEPGTEKSALVLDDPPDGVLYEFPLTLEAQFFLDVSAIGLNCLHTQVRFSGNLLGGGPATDLAKYVQLPIAEAFQRRTLRIFRATHHALHNFRAY